MGIKIEILLIIFNPPQYSNRFLLLSIYLLSYYIDLLMNIILYNEDTISEKYHNDGKLYFITSLTISLLSNILNSIIIHFINYLTNYPELIELTINEVNRNHQYINMIKNIFKIINFKFIILLIFQLVMGIFMIYYISIFSVIYSNSVNSFLLNYIFSQIESLIYSFGITLLISLLRKISLKYSLKRIYMISQYLNKNF